jgi:hypothetical protein
VFRKQISALMTFGITYHIVEAYGGRRKQPCGPHPITTRGCR